MQRISTLLALILCVIMAQAASFTEDFQSGLPTSAPSSETTVTLSSGDWKIKGVYGKNDNSSMRLTMSANGYAITPALDRPGTISFYHRASGSGKKLVVEKSTDGGSNWTKLGEVTVSSSTPYANSSFNANSAEDDTQVLIRFTCMSATIYVDDLTISLGSSGSSEGGEGGEDEPTNPDPQPEIPWTGPHSVEHCIYVAPWAPDDSGDGSWESPYYNLQKAIDMAQPGDSIYVRGGTYYPSAWRDKMSDGKLLKTNKILIDKKGDADHWFTIKTFPGEYPVLNFKDQPKGTNKSSTYGGIQLEGDYWHIYGLHITQAGDNGIKVEGSHNKIERCTFSYNDDTGLQLGFGHKFEDSHPGISSNDGSYCAYNDVIDCDSYLNCDSDNYGSDADGFACKMHNGIGNRFIRCRAWDNADDAWDLYETDYAVKLIECWAWGSGRANLFGWVSASGSFQGNGNGIKLGGNGTGGSSKGVHEAWRCVAFNCDKTGSVKGFDENSHKGGIKLVNCLAFGCGYDFMFEDCNDANNFQFYNNVCFGNIEIKGTFTESNNALLTNKTKNAWKNNAITANSFSKDDYVSLSEDDAKAPRAADGSLPTRFARLKSTATTFLDKGLDLKSEMQDEFPYLWQPIYGAARDLGPYEYAPAQATGTQVILTNDKELSLCVAHGNLQFTVPANGKAVLDLYTPQGILAANVATILATEGGQYSIPVSGQLQKGVYIARLQFGGATRSVRFTVK